MSRNDKGIAPVVILVGAVLAVVVILGVLKILPTLGQIISIPSSPVKEESVGECPHFGDGPRLVRVKSTDPYIGEWRSCYEVYNTKSRELIKPETCENFTGSESEFDNWYENLTSPYGSYLEDDCRIKWEGS